MLKRLFGRPLELNVGAGPLTFRSSRELETALSGKTVPSSTRIAILGGLSDDALMREADACRLMEQRIVGALSHPGNGIEQFLVQLDLSEITEDHDWRSIFGALRLLDGGAESYKKAALLKYVEYLGAGQQVVQTIRANRHGGAVAAEERPGRSAGASLGKTQDLVYDLAELAGMDDQGGHGDKDEFARMSKGENLEIHFGSHQSLSLMLAKYRFTLVSGDPFLLFDEAGHDLKLRPGKNIIGRSAQSDLSLDAAYGAVSRKHLIVEIQDDGRVTLTDISTLGTFAPRGYVESKLH
jgi:hypothetical protein